MTGSKASPKRGAEYVYDALVESGVDVVVGLPGTQTLPLDRIVAERDEMRYVMARHETAIPHVAWGYYEASGSVAATLTVPGPGDTNAMHGLKNALEDSVPILHVSADANPAERGTKPIHEIAPDTFDNVVKANLDVERPFDLPAALAQGVETALSAPMGPVRLGVPSGILAAEFEAPAATVTVEQTEYETADSVARAVDLLASAERPVVYAGGGARRSPHGPRVVRDLAATLDAPVATSYKGKGVFPEDDPRWLGVTGSHLPAGAHRVLDRADVVLALGTDFDGVTTDHWEMSMGDSLVHVTLDPDAINAAYDAEVPVLADVAVAGDQILDGLRDAARAQTWDGDRIASAIQAEYRDVLDDRRLFDPEAPLNTPAVVEAVREAIPRETVVTTDIGGFRLWSMQVFEAADPERFVTAGSWAGMGVGLPAAVGAALARPEDPVLTLHGDGGLLMCVQELHTAVEYDLDVTVVVSNNEDYGIISKSPAIADYGNGHQFAWDAPDFATIAEGFGTRARSVETVPGLRKAVTDAVGRDGPDLIDVAIATDEPSAAEVAEYGSTVELP